mmetsp:Transcript_60220/g.183945  ORF Transcript_60220/g.183945 Transcript_60220/m.183945 type:complete len:271 (-) Transcript_60220:543-1355(-)
MQRHTWRVHRFVAHRHGVEGRVMPRGGWRLEMLAMRSATLCLRLAIRPFVLRVLMEQRLQRGVGRDYHRYVCLFVVLHGGQTHDSRRRPRGDNRLPVPHRHRRVWLLRDCLRAVPQVGDEILRETSRGPEKQGDGVPREVLALLYMVLREVHQIPQQERVHPDGAAGHAFLHLRENSFLPHLAQRGPLWHDGGPRERDHMDWFPEHHGGHWPGGLLALEGDAPRNFARSAHDLLHYGKLCNRQAVHECLPARRRYEPSMLSRLRGDWGRQ